ncbi:hypothetical protein ACFQPA_14575 [Halomarina halobia]|uniref:Uncharacterized protein n=1 Tax=Halomarina halobia TaxID=3033386 RepID=A0ABD6A990_9EURY|nr:hypothetical protein [Halomarina sp. PSR21]
MADLLPLFVLGAVGVTAFVVARTRTERSLDRNRGIGCVLAAVLLLFGTDVAAVVDVRLPETVGLSFSIGSLLLLGAPLYYFVVQDPPAGEATAADGPDE